MADYVGQTFKGYEFQRRLGAGGFGEVYKAFQPVIKREVAVKVILPEYARQPDFIRRFEVEAELVARLEHPHIVPLFDYWREPSGAFLVLRFLRGGSLNDAIKKGPWDIEATAALLDQIAGALVVAHRNNVIHRDIKPDNILLDEDKNAYLTDFGIAKDVKHDDPGATEGIVGTPAYMSPEQITSRPVSPQTDIYSMGIVIYEMLTGRLPFGGQDSSQIIISHLRTDVPDLREIKADLPDTLNDVVQRATAKEPQARFNDMRDFARAFRSAIMKASYQIPSGSAFRHATTAISTVADPIPDHQTREISRDGVKTLSLNLDDLGEDMEIRITQSGGTKRTLITLNHEDEDDWDPTVIDHPHKTVIEDDELGEIRITRVGDLQPLADDDLGIRMTQGPARQSRLTITSDMLLSDLEFEERIIKNPYKGLRPFSEADAADFFGRDALIQRLTGRFLESPTPDQPDLSRFLAVVGASGSGKSSAVKAGLIPSLRRGSIAGSERWFIAEMVPAHQPLANLETALLSIAYNPLDDLSERLRADENGLVDVLEALFGEHNDELLLLVDQFEETFTQVADEKERALFLDVLRVATTHPQSRLRVIVTMRADFTDRPLQYVEFGEIMRQRMEFVLPLSAAELEATITGPAKRVGVEVETNLIAAIVSDVREEPGALPLLQYALTELFERREGRLMPLKAYQHSGGVLGALARRAEEVYLEMATADQAMLRQIFLRLVTVGDHQNDTRRRAKRSELAMLGEVEAVDRVLNKFGQYRLLSFDVDSGTREPTIEVAHEALIREWARLREWLDNSRADIRLQRLLGAAAYEWQHADHDNSFLLSGARLAQYEEWVDTTDLILTPDERAFVEASVAERNRLASVEKERQERELQTQRELAEQRRRAAQRLQWFVAALAIFLLVAIGLAVLAFDQRSEAQSQRDIAEDERVEAQTQRDIAEDERTIAERRALEAQSVALAANAQPLLDSNTLLALRLAYQANQMADPPLVSQVLLAAAGYRPGATQGFVGHTDTVNVVAFSPDGQTFLSGSRDNTIMLWDVNTGEKIREYTHHRGWVNDLVWLSDGQRAISASDDTTIVLFDIETGAVLQTFTGHTDFVDSLALSHDETLLASGSGDDVALIWEVATGEIVQELAINYDDPDGINFVTEVEFAPDDQTLMLSYELPDFNGEGMFLFAVNTGELLYEYYGDFYFITDVKFFADGERVITTTADAQILIWDIASQEIIYDFLPAHVDYIWNIALTADETQAVSVGDDRQVILWDVERGEPLTIFTGHTAFVAALDVRADGLIVTGSADKTALLWRDVIGNITQTYLGHEDMVNRVDFAPNGQAFASASQDATVMLWDNNTSEPRLRLEGHTAPVLSVAYSPDGSRLVSASSDGTLILWDTATGEALQTLTGHAGVVLQAVFSPDGRHIFSVSDDTTGILWDAETGEIQLQLKAAEDSIDPLRTVAFSPDGTQVLAGDQSGRAVLWDITTGEKRLEIKAHALAINDVLFSPDGRYGFTASAENNIIMWDLSTGAEVRRFVGHTDYVLGIDLSADGTRLVSASYDTTLILWDVATGAALRRLEGSYSFVQDVQFSPDEKFLLSGDQRNQVVLWRVDDLEALLAWVEANRYLRPLTCQEREAYFLPLGADCPPPSPDTPAD